MSDSTEEHPMGERRGRVQTPSSAVMNQVGIELTRLAREVAEGVFEHMGPRTSQDREARLNELLSDMEWGLIPLDETIEPIALRQGKAAIAEKREHHADRALRQAAAVRHIYLKILSPEISPLINAGDESLIYTFKRMQSALLEAQRHLTALDILKNLEGKHYSQRASKGGHAKPRPVSERDQETLLGVMIKNMLYNDPDAIKRAQSRSAQLAQEWAQRIFKANREFQYLNIASLDQLQTVVHTLLLNHRRRLETGKDASKQYILRRLSGQLRQPRDAFHDEDTVYIEAELAGEKRFLEGIQSVLAYLLEVKFGELPCEALDAIRDMDSVNDLQTCFDILPETASWQDVLQARASAS